MMPAVARLLSIATLLLAGLAQAQSIPTPESVLGHKPGDDFYLATTGYFGNEGSYVDFYVYGALHVDMPPHGAAARATAKAKPAHTSTSAPRKRK